MKRWLKFAFIIRSRYSKVNIFLYVILFLVEGFQFLVEDELSESVAKTFAYLDESIPCFADCLSEADTLLSVSTLSAASVSLPNLSSDEIEASPSVAFSSVAAAIVKQPVAKTISSPDNITESLETNKQLSCLAVADDPTALSTNRSRLLKLTTYPSEPKPSCAAKSKLSFLSEHNLLERSVSLSPKVQSRFLEVPKVVHSPAGITLCESAELNSATSMPNLLNKPAKKQTTFQKLSLSFSSLSCSPKRRNKSEFGVEKPMQRACSLKIRKKDKSAQKTRRPSIIIVNIHTWYQSNIN